MKVCRQGQGHFIDGLNNQDYYYMENNIKIITDGCSEGKFSEVGTRLFAQYFSKLDSRFDCQKFEENVEKVFSTILSNYKRKLKSDECREFIVNNLLFTILACFELEDRFVVKTIGDGYIITVNKNNMVSYTRLSYGKRPPYYSYNMLDVELYKEELKFKTFEYSKEDFCKVGIASDGFAPIAEKKISDNFVNCIIGDKNGAVYSPEGIIKANINQFYDDVTILI